jgi:hypothetical protein
MSTSTMQNLESNRRTTPQLTLQVSLPLVPAALSLDHL